MAGWWPQVHLSHRVQGKVRAKHFLNDVFATQLSTAVPDAAGGCQLLPTSPGHAGKTPGFSDSLSS